MLIDRWLPQYDVVETHETTIRAPASRVYEALWSVDLGRSRMIRLLFGLRSLRVVPRGTASRLGLSLAELLRTDFVLLEEREGQEVVLGLVGRFWMPSGGLLRVTPEEFRTLDQPGYVKAAWSFSLEPAGEATRLRTDTRVLCLGETARRRFRLYWLLVGPFSGRIRREMLRLIRLESELP